MNSCCSECSGHAEPIGSGRMQQDLLHIHNGDIQLQEAWIAEEWSEAVVTSGGKQILKLGEHGAHLV